MTYISSIIIFLFEVFISFSFYTYFTNVVSGPLGSSGLIIEQIYNCLTPLKLWIGIHYGEIAIDSNLNCLEFSVFLLKVASFRRVFRLSPINKYLPPRNCTIELWRKSINSIHFIWYFNRRLRHFKFPFLFEP